jgi:hypothetical protein
MFVDNAFQVEYDINKKVVFIEVSRHDEHTVLINDIDVHRSDADVILGILNKLDSPLISDSEYPCNQTFPRINVSIYREHSEKDKIDAFGISTPGYRD